MPFAMTRRAVLAAIGAALTAPLPAWGRQTPKVWRVGLVCASSCESLTAAFPRPMTEFAESLRKAGYVEGKNLSIDFRGAGVADNRLDAVVGQLVADKIDVIVVAGTSGAVAAARRATRSIPIVMAISDDADEMGLVGSLARPGGNVTGVSIPLRELVTKQVQLLTEVIPTLSSLTILANPNNPGHRRAAAIAREAAQSLRRETHLVSVASPVGYEQAFAEIKNTRADALLVLPDPLLERGEVTLFALTARLPAMFTFEGPVVTAGGLIAYGPNVVELHRRAAAYVVKILKGARAGDLPVEQPTTFQLVINLQAAKALGLSIPPSLLLRADRVIE